MYILPEKVRAFTTFTFSSLLFLLPDLAAPESCWVTDLCRPPRLPNEVAVAAGVIHGDGGRNPPAPVVTVWARKNIFYHRTSLIWSLPLVSPKVIQRVAKILFLGCVTRLWGGDPAAYAECTHSPQPYC